MSGTANLPSIELDTPPSVIAKNTVHSMQAGTIYGFAGLVQNIVAKIKQNLGRPDTIVIATGGMSGIVYKEAGCIDVVDRTLTLNGLKVLYDLNGNKDE